MKAKGDFNPLGDDRQMAGLIAEVSGSPVEEVREKLEQERRRPGCTVAEELIRRGVRSYVWSPELESFYGTSDAFLYELAVWNRNLFKSLMRTATVRHLSRSGRSLDVLSIGDGLGFDCLQFSERGHRVSYHELPGPAERFARMLIARAGADVRVITDSGGIAAEAFDAITCFDVLEHVPDPLGMVRQLAGYLRPGGVAYVNAPFYMVLPWYPTHLRMNRRFSGSLELYRQAGLRLVGGIGMGQGVVLQKPGGERMATNIISSLVVHLQMGAQRLGRWTAWPYLPLHMARRVLNRKF